MNKYSPTHKYIIQQNNPHILYSLKKLNYTFLLENIVTINNIPYYEYKYDIQTYPYINDCLQFVEGLLINQPGYSKQKPVSRAISLSKNRVRIIGESDEKNISVAKDVHFQYNENAKPNIGQAYAIIRKKVIIGEHPYHIAYVLAKDEDWTITIEADASDPSRYYPLFDMYSTDSSSMENFHKKYIAYYYPASTLILKGNN